MPLEPVLRGHLIKLFQAYAEHTEVAFSTVSQRFTGDVRFYDKLVSGKSRFSVYIYDRAVAKFAHHWPATLRWPDGIEKIPLSKVPERPRKKREPQKRSRGKRAPQKPAA